MWRINCRQLILKQLVGLLIGFKRLVNLWPFRFRARFVLPFPFCSSHSLILPIIYSSRRCTCDNYNNLLKMMERLMPRLRIYRFLWNKNITTTRAMTRKNLTLKNLDIKVTKNFAFDLLVRYLWHCKIEFNRLFFTFCLTIKSAFREKKFFLETR